MKKILLTVFAGFGVKPGVYEFMPTYMPEGMDVKTAQKNLFAIQVAAGQRAELVIIDGAEHAFFDEVFYK